MKNTKGFGFKISETLVNWSDHFFNGAENENLLSCKDQSCDQALILSRKSIRPKIAIVIFKSVICAKWRLACVISVCHLSGSKCGLVTTKKLAPKFGICAQKITLTGIWSYWSEYGLAKKRYWHEITLLFFLVHSHIVWLFKAIDSRMFVNKRIRFQPRDPREHRRKSPPTPWRQHYISNPIVQDIIRIFKIYFHPPNDSIYISVTWLLLRKIGERFFLPTLNGPTHLRGKKYWFFALFTILRFWTRKHCKRFNFTWHPKK